MTIVNKIIKAWLESDVMKYRLTPYGIALSESEFKNLKDELYAIPRYPPEIRDTVDYGMRINLPQCNHPLPVYFCIYNFDGVRFLI